MGLLVLCVFVVVVVASLPFWLPSAVVALRERIFTWVNGNEGIPLPGPLVDASAFRQVYSHPAANGRSRGAGLSDLFWYWLAPGPQVHQEHLEAGKRYDQVARTTRQILAAPKSESEDLVLRCAIRVLDELPTGKPNLVRLRDMMMPIWAEVYYELVFHERCPAHVRELIVGNANDVVTALKGCGLRHMRKRDLLTAYLKDRIAEGTVPGGLPDLLTAQEQAYYLQGTFFNTAVVQMSEAMTHVLLAIAQHPEVQGRLVADAEDDDYVDHVINETLRVYPLFGIAHRITTADIEVNSSLTLHSGSVLLFNYSAYQNSGFSDAARFDPDRWRTLSARDATYIPFGVTANRPCPAKGVAPLSMRVVAREVLRRYALSSSVSHTRSIPHRGPCLLVPRSTPAATRSYGARLALMRLRDRWEDVGRSLVQLLLGSYMVWDARRKRLGQRYFEPQDGRSATCPVGHER